MKNIKKIIIAVMSIILLQSCEKEKIDVQQIEGYLFSSNPKKSSSENTIREIFSAVNKSQESIAEKNNEKTYVGFELENDNENTEKPIIENTDYMFIFNQKEFDKAIENANIYGQKPKNSVDFSQEFVFVLNHPSKFISGLQFYDGLDAFVENENTIQIKPIFSELQYSQSENEMYNYGEYDCQVSMFKIQKSEYKNINILWETGAIENLKMGK